MKNRNFIVTCFNHVEWCKENFAFDKIQFLTWQLEKCPTTAKIHVQAFIITKDKITYKSLISILGVKCHIEVAKGSIDECIRYCNKSETRFKKGKTHGDIKNVVHSAQGKRNDLDTFYTDIKNNFIKGIKPIEIFEKENDNKNLSKIIRYYPSMNRIYNDLLFKNNMKNMDKPLNVIFIYGEAGTGKTKYVYNNHEMKDIYKPHLCSDKIWFDGYSNQKVLFLDEFRGQIQFTFLLQLLDLYALSLPIKGGFVSKAWTTVYMVSNKAPWECYPNLGFPKEFRRRISKVYTLNAGDTTLNEVADNEVDKRVIIKSLLSDTSIDNLIDVQTGCLM